jgi:hypothetical protein
MCLIIRYCIYETMYLACTRTDAILERQIPAHPQSLYRLTRHAHTFRIITI